MRQARDSPNRHRGTGIVLHGFSSAPDRTPLGLAGKKLRGLGFSLWDYEKVRCPNGKNCRSDAVTYREFRRPSPDKRLEPSAGSARSDRAVGPAESGRRHGAGSSSRGHASSSTDARSCRTRTLAGRGRRPLDHRMRSQIRRIRGRPSPSPERRFRRCMTSRRPCFVDAAVQFPPSCRAQWPHRRCTVELALELRETDRRSAWMACASAAARRRRFRSDKAGGQMSTDGLVARDKAVRRDA